MFHWNFLRPRKIKEADTKISNIIRNKYYMEIKHMESMSPLQSPPIVTLGWNTAHYTGPHYNCREKCLDVANLKL